MSEEQIFLNLRESIVSETNRILLGPMNGDKEILEKPPHNFYTTGILYPQRPRTEDLHSDPEIDNPLKDENSVDENNSTWDDNDEENHHSSPANIAQKNFKQQQKETDSILNEELLLATEFKPSALGISAIVNKEEQILVEVRYGEYEKIAPKEIEYIDKKTDEKKTYDISRFQRQPRCFRVFVVITGDTIQYKKSADTNCDSNIEIIPSGNCLRIFHGTKDDLTSPELRITRRKLLLRKSASKRIIITASLINRITVSAVSEFKRPDLCIFQPEIRLVSEKPVFYSFDDDSDLSVLDFEEKQLKLLYRNYKNYALGHGVSVDWDVPKDNQPATAVFTRVIPRYELNGIDFQPKGLLNSDILFMKRLSGEDFYCREDKSISKQQLKNELREFINCYKVWIDNQHIELNKEQSEKQLKPVLADVGRKNLSKCAELYSRMETGIRLLETDDDILKAFNDANKAMFIQRIMSQFAKFRRKKNGTDLAFDKFDEPLPDFRTDIRYTGEYLKADGYEFSAKWRPFQLAFLLSQIEGITNPESKDRDTVDLIWFPTGGGKTEAYLGLTAFTIFFRRLRAKRQSDNPDNGAGVSVMMRYTLRMLNKQQFSRANTLICACELIRRKESENYGKQRISNGIWVGGSLTPNSHTGEDGNTVQLEKYMYNIEKKETGTVKYSPAIFNCPCCGNRLVKEKYDNDVKGKWGYFRKTNLKGKRTGPYIISCTNACCDFYVDPNKLNSRNEAEIEKTLPLYYVDDDIYEHRPSLLFSTVDKYASIAWRDKSFKLFNFEIENSNFIRCYPGPELIVQDELHLISSALGTIYAVYEIAIDHLCSEKGHKPKIVGATATVRNAERQCSNLYAREHFLQFPPPGIDADDSFFSVKKETDKNNRLYLGFMPAGNTNTVAQIRLISTLSERIPTFSEYPNKYLDYYYTILVYFNTLKELGKFRTLSEDDIAAYRKFLAGYFNSFYIPFVDHRSKELSSAMNADDINNGLDLLENVMLPDHKDINPFLKDVFSKGVRSLTDISNNEKGQFGSVFGNPDFFAKHSLPFIPVNSLDDWKQNHKTFRDKLDKYLDASERDAVKIASATNMISVGVDIARLNVMQITGQPKSTSEYIQASSRVGREKPGIVFTTYNPAKNRDRSHYERFKSYHQAYYKYVETTSVTPFSLPALEKAVPSVLIALMRSLYYKTNSRAAWDKNAESFFEGLTNSIVQRITKISSVIKESDQERDRKIQYLNQVTEEIKQKWKNLEDRRFTTFRDFIYGLPNAQTLNEILFADAQYSEEKNLRHLLYCLTSLRNVEVESGISIKKYE